MGGFVAGETICRRRAVTMQPPREFIRTAEAAADAARALAMQYFRGGLTVANKDDDSPVTAADRAVEARIKEVILTRHPTHGFFGEEGGEAGADDGEWRWVIDPIDGTKSFVTGNRTFGCLIALLHRGRAVLGVIDHAALDERWLGVAGRATTHNGVACRASDCRDLARATLYATTPDMFAGAAATRFARLSAKARFRAFGGDCYSYGLLASGFVDLICEAQMKPYDFLALSPVVEGAGGVISDWRGERLGADSDGTVLASANRELHAAALATLTPP